MCPVIIKLIIRATLAYGATDGPKSSTDIMLDVIGVFVPPARTETSPIAAKVDAFKSNIFANNTPDVVPMKNMGVITPPLPPKFRVIDVKTIFTRKA